MPQKEQTTPKRPIYKSPDGFTYTLLLYAVHGYWEWYGFELAETTDTDEIYFGYVMGDFPELGYFSKKELLDNGISICTDPEELLELLPPIGWTREC